MLTRLTPEQKAEMWHYLYQHTSIPGCLRVEAEIGPNDRTKLYCTLLEIDALCDPVPCGCTRSKPLCEEGTRLFAEYKAAMNAIPSTQMQAYYNKLYGSSGRNFRFEQALHAWCEHVRQCGK
jgi:hypothetical protein